MGKTDFWAPKAIANRQKAKGLGRLRWYCQMCQKQCRDSNGFKCHTQTEGHIRQIQVFKSNTGKFMDEFSRDFEKTFISTLSRKHNTKRVKANNVYQEMIQDKHHVHMNATYWGSLSSFIKYLGQKGICKVEDTDEGWYITYIDRDPRTLARMAQDEKKKRLELDAEDRHNEEIRRQIEEAKQHAQEAEEGFTELQQDSSDVTLDINLGFSSALKPKKGVPLKDSRGSNLSKDKIVAPSTLHHTASALSSPEVEDPLVKKKRLQSVPHLTDLLPTLGPHKRAKFDDLAALQKDRPNINLVNGCWLMPGLVVKLVSSKFDESLRKRKGVVVALDEKNVGSAEIRLLDKSLHQVSSQTLRVRQSQLETVVPKLGSMVAIVSKSNTFPNRGETGKLMDIDLDKFCVTVKLLTGKNQGRTIASLDYENICKLL